MLLQGTKRTLELLDLGWCSWLHFYDLVMVWLSHMLKISFLYYVKRHQEHHWWLMILLDTDWCWSSWWHFFIILIWFDGPTCQISALYIEFKGIKNPPANWWHCWRLRGHWSFLTGAEVSEDVFDDLNMVWQSYMPNLSFLHWFWRHQEPP